MELYNKENAPPTILKSFAEEFEEGIQQGREQGEKFAKQDIAKKLILQNMPLETIGEVTGLTFEEVTAIQKSMN